MVVVVSMVLTSLQAASKCAMMVPALQRQAIQEGGGNIKNRNLIPGVDNLTFLEDTQPAKEESERNRYILSISLSIISTVASVVAVIVSILALLR